MIQHVQLMEGAEAVEDWKFQLVNNIKQYVFLLLQVGEPFCQNNYVY